MPTSLLQGLTWITLILGLLIPAHGYAGDVLHSYVDYEDGHFFLQLDMRITARADKVYGLLVDFNHLTRLNNNIIKSELLETTDNQIKVLVETRGCIWFFCKHVKQVQSIRKLPNGYLLAATLPEESDLEFGNVLWHIRQDGKTTLISYSADFIPAFWVPPLIGPWLMNSRLLLEGKETINNIEILAQRK